LTRGGWRLPTEPPQTEIRPSRTGGFHATSVTQKRQILNHADFRQFTKDLLKLRSSQPALRAPSARVSRCQNFERVLVLHRWLEGIGGDIVVVASIDELPKYGYTAGLPYAGTWKELFNSDYYYQFPNPAVVGNGGLVQANGGPLDGFASSATMTIPGNGVIVLGR